MKTNKWLLSAALAALALTGVCEAHFGSFGGARYYVAPDGNDNWSGLLAAPNITGTDGPLATVAKAQARMRAGAVKRSVLRGGEYRLHDNWIFGAADNGTRWESYAGETATVDGGDAYVITFRYVDGIEFDSMQIRHLLAQGVTHISIDATGAQRLKFNKMSFQNMSANAFHCDACGSITITNTTFGNLSSPGSCSFAGGGALSSCTWGGAAMYATSFTGGGNNITLQHNLFQAIGGGAIGFAVAAVAGGGTPAPPPPTPTCTVSALTQSAIQTCLSSVSSGGVVLLPAGTYNLSSGLTMPTVPFTMTGVRAKSIINGASLGDYAIILNNDGQTIENLVFKGAGVGMNGCGETIQYNLFLDIQQTVYAVRDNCASNQTVRYNILTWTTVCTTTCLHDSLFVIFYKTDSPFPTNVDVSYNYLDGYWEGIANGGNAFPSKGSNVRYTHNTFLHGFRMAIEDGTPTVGLTVSDNYFADWVKANGTNLDDCGGVTNVDGLYDCNSFAISIAGGGSTNITIDNNRVFAPVAGVCDGSWNDPCMTWGIESSSDPSGPGVISQSNNKIFGPIRVGIWDDADSGNPTTDRVHTLNNTLCNVWSANTRGQGESPPWGGVGGGGNVYTATCPARDAVPCPPFDMTTGATPSGCPGGGGGGTTTPFTTTSIDKNRMSDVARNVEGTVSAWDDAAAIYISDGAGTSTGWSITNNVIDNVDSTYWNHGTGHADGWVGSRGIYVGGVTSATVTGNIISRGGVYALVYAGAGGAVISNNIFDLSSHTTNLALYQQLASESMSGNTFRKNLTYTSGTATSVPIWINQHGSGSLPTVNTNLYYAVSGGTWPNPDNGITDSSPTYSNPLFTSPSTGDYSMSGSSPAFTVIGFTALPTDIGPQ